jgi:hypothetical protein
MNLLINIFFWVLFCLCSDVSSQCFALEHHWLFSSLQCETLSFTYVKTICKNLGSYVLVIILS